MDNANYELKNKDLHLVKADRENFWTLMDLRVSKDQEEFVASNSVSLAQAYDDRIEHAHVLLGFSPLLHFIRHIQDTAREHEHDPDKNAFVV